MMILGYGEDAHTFEVLTGRIREVFDKLEDPSPGSDAICFYRPSFGRRGSSVLVGTLDSAQFGEFDAIIGTPVGVYLVEAKWSRSGELRKGEITLRPEQVTRHRIFAAYLNAWREKKPSSWGTFSESINGYLALTDAKAPVAPINSRLAKNLEFVLSRLSACGKKTVDVLLYIRVGNEPAATMAPDGFRMVSIDAVDESGFVEV